MPTTSPIKLALVAAVLLGMPLMADAQCVDSRSRAKCVRKLHRRPNKCQRSRFRARCAYTCNLMRGTPCTGGSSGPVPPISNACGCTIYQDGATPSSTTACVKYQHFNGRPR